MCLTSKFGCKEKKRKAPWHTSCRGWKQFSSRCMLKSATLMSKFNGYLWYIKKRQILLSPLRFLCLGYHLLRMPLSLTSEFRPRGSSLGTAKFIYLFLSQKVLIWLMEFQISQMGSSDCGIKTVRMGIWTHFRPYPGSGGETALLQKLLHLFFQLFILKKRFFFPQFLSMQFSFFFREYPKKKNWQKKNSFIFLNLQKYKS